MRSPLELLTEPPGGVASPNPKPEIRNKYEIQKKKITKTSHAFRGFEFVSGSVGSVEPEVEETPLAELAPLTIGRA
jgi:hypothetical protein